MLNYENKFENKDATIRSFPLKKSFSKLQRKRILTNTQNIQQRHGFFLKTWRTISYRWPRVASAKKSNSTCEMLAWIASVFDSSDIVQFLFMLCSLQNRRIDLFESPPALGCRFFIWLLITSYDNPCLIKLLTSSIVKYREIFDILSGLSKTAVTN